MVHLYFNKTDSVKDKEKISIQFYQNRNIQVFITYGFDKIK